MATPARYYSRTYWSSSPWLVRLAVPVLVLAGSRDPMVPQRNGRILARSIPGAQLRVVEGGQLFLLEQPEEGCLAIGEFLAEVDTGATPTVAGRCGADHADVTT